MSYPRFDDRTLSVHIMRKGFAFAVFEGTAPIDWGVCELRGSQKNARCISGISRRIDQYQPATLILETCAGDVTRRSARVRRLYLAAETCARGENIDVYGYSRTDIQACFKVHGAQTKYEIAQTITRLMPEFEPRLPPLRKSWAAEDPRMGLFEAIAQAMTFFHTIDAPAARGEGNP